MNPVRSFARAKGASPKDLGGTTSYGMKKFFVLNLVSLFLLSGNLAQANGFGMQLDKVVGEHTVNVDYDATNGIYTGAPVQFAFQLFNKERTQQMDFDDVWVTITNAGSDASYIPPVFDGGIVGHSASLIPSGMTFVFPKGGSYDLKLRFDKGEKSIAEATFSLTVSGGGSSSSEGSIFSKNFFVGGLSALVLGGGVLLLIKLLKRKSNLGI